MRLEDRGTDQDPLARLLAILFPQDDAGKQAVTREEVTEGIEQVWALLEDAGMETTLVAPYDMTLGDFPVCGGVCGKRVTPDDGALHFTTRGLVCSACRGLR